ncbi:NYN domain-containing protein [Nocardioides zeae]|uniref:NYN domain-containing protein n=1 Tax=Nocardioides imazamoxiresistens TaxID=3231893 RepID=A0ABU3PUE7_9ACTN|nr:NYN domain-containing protein [Nocardioides zeae]MDT9592852.1 NYN domain-containing protein [Nocardioides zeae]
MSETRVALYLDFENLVASQYDAVHGRNAWHKDRVVHAPAGEPEVRAKLKASRLDVDAIVDYAASLGVVAVNRAYANWACPAFTGYAEDLTSRAVDLTQLFPLSGTKNGADIRLATDVLDDLGRFHDLTHVVIAAGDSDYVAVAQKARRAGRSVVGVGVAGSIGKYWEAACDEFKRYDALPGVDPQPAEEPAPETSTADPAEGSDAGTPDDRAKPVPYAKLFRRAMNNILRQRSDDRVPMSELKQVLMRMSPGFDEATLGYSSFSAYVRDQAGVATDAKNQLVWFEG